MLRLQKFAQIVFGIVLLGSLAQGAHAATFTVTKTTDTADGTCDSDCSLREAVIAANTAGGSNTVTLPAGTYDLSIVTTVNSTDPSDTAAAGDLDITSDITINGEATDVTIITTSNNDKVFHGLTGNNATLTLNKLTFQGITRTSTSAIGGSVVEMQTGTLTMEDCVVKNNTLTGMVAYGGAIISNNNTINIFHSTFSNNSVISAGSNASGGVLDTANSIVTIMNSTFNNNTVTGANTGTGGVVSANTGNTISITSSTFSDNTVVNGTNSAQGGAIYSSGGSITLMNTILSNNTSGGHTDSNCSGAVIMSGGYNIDSGSTCALSGTADQSSTGNDVIGLKDLADNGGSTPTQALELGSVAIDAIAADSVNCTGVTADQRNYARPQNTNCDVGAYEYKDADNDGYVSEADCDDEDGDIYAEQTYYQDQDGDGNGSDYTVEVCSTTPPAGYVENSDDNDDTDFSNGSIMSVAGAENGIVQVTYDNGTTTEFDIFTNTGVPVPQLASDGVRVVTTDSLGQNLAVFNGQTGEVYLKKTIHATAQKFVRLMVHDYYTKNDVDEVIVSSRYNQKLTTTLFVLNPENTIKRKNTKRLKYTQYSVELSAKKKKVVLKYNGVAVKRYRVSVTDMLR